MLWLDLGPIWGGGEREAEGGVRLELDDLDQGAGPLRLGPLVQLALALAGETETQRWAVTCLGPWQRLEGPSLTLLLWPPSMAGLVAGRMQSDRPVWALLTQSISAGTRVEEGRHHGHALMSALLQDQPRLCFLLCGRFAQQL